MVRALIRLEVGGCPGPGELGQGEVAVAIHGVGNDNVLHAVANAFVIADMGDDDSPLRTLVLGPDRSGNMLKVIVLHNDEREMVIHAMPMRAHYRGLLPRPPETRS